MSSTIHACSNLQYLGPLLIGSDIFNGYVLLMRVNLYGGTVPKMGEGHLIHSQSASFIGTDVISAAHCLAGLHFSDQVIVSEHLFDRDSKGEGDREG